ncbi:hypothetical protein LX82_03712 [Celeribacter halophilus]|uniref:Uncharacterized protein n=1 Tax=Celeribacter halophilus TaxID=576117 RepID=A0A1I3X929_9RHOB|nr:hypothetical protein LX82_03712 [Celeribacter halophilus]SFK15809.1 hypothetical protein SAMN04488138_1437 [Celeribacter halophilus]
MAAMTSGLVASFDIFEARHRIILRIGVNVQIRAPLRIKPPNRNGFAFYLAPFHLAGQNLCADVQGHAHSQFGIAGAHYCIQVFRCRGFCQLVLYSQ